MIVVHTMEYLKVLAEWCETEGICGIMQTFGIMETQRRGKQHKMGRIREEQPQGNAGRGE